MPKATNLNVRIGAELGEFVAGRVGENGSFENTSEYVRDLIRRDKERSEAQAFQRLKAELQLAFAAPDDDAEELTADDIIARNPTIAG